MSLILNEVEYAENIIAGSDLGKSPATALRYVARYLSQVRGCKRPEVRKKIEQLLIQREPFLPLLKWEPILDSIAKGADKYPLIVLDGIDITEDEMRCIRSYGGAQRQKLSFTLLCAAKYWNAVRSTNNNWANTPDKDIMKMANISPTIEKQCELYRSLRDDGLLQFSKRVDNLNVRVTFVMDNSPVVLHVTDTRNLGNQYSAYWGGPYFQCEHCGLTVRRTGNAQKYCKACAEEVHLAQTAQSVARSRACRSS